MTHLSPFAKAGPTRLPSMLRMSPSVAPLRGAAVRS